MADEEWLAGSFATLLVRVCHTPETRKGDLFAVACARVIWRHLCQHIRKEIEQIERRADDPDMPLENVNVLEVGYPSSWVVAKASRAAAEGQWPLRSLFFDTGENYDGFGHDIPARLETEWAARLRDIYGNLFRPVAFDPSWRTSAAVALARQMYEGRDFALMPILADALQDAGCEQPDVLAHCRDPQQVHVRGCWVVDLVLGKA